MRFGNSNIAFRRILNQGSQVDANYEACTYKGIALKTAIFLLTALIGAGIGIGLLVYKPEIAMAILAVSGIFTIIFSLVAMISFKSSKVFGILYCITEGILLGCVSFICSSLLEGAVSIALLSTIAVFGVVTFLFVGNVVKVNNKFIKFLMIFAISFIIVTLFTSIISIWVPISFGFSLAISAVSVFLATLYLFFDLENIRTMVEGGYPKEMEWNAAFGLSFTLIWLYVEILELVVKIVSFVDRR